MVHVTLPHIYSSSNLSIVQFHFGKLFGVSWIRAVTQTLALDAKVKELVVSVTLIWASEFQRGERCNRKVVSCWDGQIWGSKKHLVSFGNLCNMKYRRPNLARVVMKNPSTWFVQKKTFFVWFGSGSQGKKCLPQKHVHVMTTWNALFWNDPHVRVLTFAWLKIWRKNIAHRLLAPYMHFASHLAKNFLGRLENWNNWTKRACTENAHIKVWDSKSQHMRWGSWEPTIDWQLASHNDARNQREIILQSLWTCCIMLYLSVDLSVYLSASLSANLSIYQSFHLPICQPAYLSIHLYLSIYRSTYLSFYLPSATQSGAFESPHHLHRTGHQPESSKTRSERVGFSSWKRPIHKTKCLCYQGIKRVAAHIRKYYSGD